MSEPRVRRFPGRDGRWLTYREVGDGRPLVLFHGFTASGTQWLDFGPAEELASQGRRVVLPDMRGHGDGTRTHDPSAYPPDVLTDDGLALVEHLGLDDYDLGGYSLGGRIALRMLTRGARPARAIVAGQGLASVTGSARGGALHHVLTALAEGEDIAPGSPDAQTAHWITTLGGDPQALLHVLASLVPTSGAALGTITTPVLVVVGDQDHGQATADELAAALPGGRFAQVPGDHWSALTAPELGSAITTFLG